MRLRPRPRLRLSALTGRALPLTGRAMPTPLRTVLGLTRLPTGVQLGMAPGTPTAIQGTPEVALLGGRAAGRVAARAAVRLHGAALLVGGLPSQLDLVLA